MAAVLLMSSWHTTKGTTEEYWDLIWYPHAVVFRFTGESFRDILVRTGPLRDGGPPREAREELSRHPRNHALPMKEIKRVVLYRRLLLRLPRLEIECLAGRFTFYSRDRSHRPFKDVEKLRQIVPPHVNIEIV